MFIFGAVFVMLGSVACLEGRKVVGFFMLLDPEPSNPKP